MGGIIFRAAQCLSVLGEESPESMVGGRVTLFDFAASDGLGQWVLRHTQLEFRAGAVDGGHTARLAQVTSVARGGSGGRKVRGLGRRPIEREMEGRGEVWGRQFTQRESAGLASQTQDGLAMHCEERSLRSRRDL